MKMMKRINFDGCIEKFDELLDIAKDGINDKKKIGIEIDKYRVTIKGGYGDVLRLKSNKGRELVLEHIELENKGAGVGANVLKWLKGYVKENRFNVLTIESIVSTEMLNLCKKHNLNKSSLYDRNYYIKL